MGRALEQVEPMPEFWELHKEVNAEPTPTSVDHLAEPSLGSDQRTRHRPVSQRPVIVVEKL